MLKFEENPNSKHLRVTSKNPLQPAWVRQAETQKNKEFTTWFLIVNPYNKEVVYSSRSMRARNKRYNKTYFGRGYKKVEWRDHQYTVDVHNGIWRWNWSGSNAPLDREKQNKEAEFRSCCGEHWQHEHLTTHEWYVEEKRLLIEKAKKATETLLEVLL